MTSEFNIKQECCLTDVDQAYSNGNAYDLNLVGFSVRISVSTPIIFADKMYVFWDVMPCVVW
jgi:hypothetical protein